MIEDEESVKIKNKSEAIRKLYPQVATITPGEVWKCVDKNNVSVAIDESKVTKEVDRADAEYASLAYARKRKDEYPPLAEQERIVAKLDTAFAKIEAFNKQVSIKKSELIPNNI